MSSVKERKEIDDSFKWKLSDIFSSDDEWESAAEEVKAHSEEFFRKRENDINTAESLFSLLEEFCEIEEKLLSVIAYAGMKRDENNEDSKYRALAERAADIESACMSACSFLEPALIALGKEKIEAFMRENHKLQIYKQFFENLFREEKHILDERGERILAMSSPMGDAPHDIFSAMNNADIRFGTITDENGNEAELTHGRYGVFLESPDRKVRKAAYEAMYAQYKNFKNTFAAMYAGSVKTDLFYARVRGFDSTIQMRLSDNNIEEKVYNTLIEEVNKGLPALSDYLKIRKERLSLSELKMYDLYTSFVPESKEEIPYEDAKRLVLEAVSPLGEEYVSDMKKAFESGWVDVYENRGKTSGAYSWGDTKNHPFVLLNYQGTLEDVFTLAHEMGHAMHSYYTNKTQPPVYRSYKIFVAEVASIVNEILLLEYLLRDAKGERREYLLGRKLEAIRTTFYRQTMFAEFEKKAHSLYSAGEALTSERLCSLYGELNSKYYGKDVLCDENISYEWARIPHFYTSFYVYQYATGYAAATLIKDRVLSSTKAAKKYISFLSGGSSMYPLELLKTAGVDLSDGTAARSVCEDMKAACKELLSK